MALNFLSRINHAFSDSLFLEQSISSVVGGFTVSFIMFLLLVKPFIRWMKKEKIQDTPEKEFCEKLHALHGDKQKTPTMGGILMGGVLFIVCLLGLGWGSSGSKVFLFAIAAWSLLGFADDIIKQKRKKGHGLSAKRKFIIQLLIASVSVASLVEMHASSCKEASSIRVVKATDISCVEESFFVLNIPFTKAQVHIVSKWGKVALFLFAVVAIVGTVNAVNLTDGLDGLAAGCMIMAAMSFMIATVLTQYFSPGSFYTSVVVLKVLSSVVGVCLGFFLYNKFPAKIFMGDTGSMMLGGILGTCAVALRQELLLIIIGGVFVTEALSVIIQVMSFRIRRKRVFLCSPLHHHFEYKGVSERKVVSRFWIAGFVLGLVGILSVILRVS